MNSYKFVFHFAFFVMFFSLSGCLTPEERAEVYGHGQHGDMQSESSALDEANVKTNTGLKTDHEPPKAAPTIAITTNTIAPISGLRRAEDSFNTAITANAADDCGIAEVQHLQGQTLASLRSMRFKQQIRINLPGKDITEDFKPMRLNFDVTNEGVIGRLWCG
jgi:hypothetical protein